MKTTFSYDFQYLRKGQQRPDDDGEVVACNSNDNPLLILPNVGDYISITNKGGRAQFDGKVKTRLFSYVRIDDDHVHCSICIVVEEVDMDKIWGTLIKE
ncbi:hypothetical protein JQ771_26820 [Klebsiella quasipneumoniae subsp. similipneumoniae]|uniref:hypothetical protein n=1 Tax=Klebsiella quasipneumoniae TaxID=1463165 RepID=UPI000659014B|nr:hypothetical protein [Klebsiella quasipneumoniae]KMI31910.1 hypothetical protein SM89_02761 [Klebsiella quasipneumoniae]MCJ1841924.1 hypothetical protein [Klebsiella quasipneumoniae subsp. similipneumoniae]